MQASRCHLTIDPPAPGTWNMAADEVLLHEAAEKGTATLRFYQWIEPTLSLGYFQRYRDRQQHAASRQAAIVRRQTGGGAILHDRELTYSLVLPAAHPLARQTGRLYGVVHDAFIEALLSIFPDFDQQWRLVRNDRKFDVANPPQPFLCFQRRAVGDVLLVSEPRVGSGWKVLGSAQRRHRGAVLQHGGLLLARSPAAPELPGLLELTGRDLHPPDLAAAVGVRVAEALELPLIESPIAPELQSNVAELAYNKYGQASWTIRR